MAQMQSLTGSMSASVQAEHVLSLVREFETATVITHTRFGSLHGRPMSIAEVAKDGTVWFITSLDSAKVNEIHADTRAMVSLQKTDQYVTIYGHLEVVQDRAKVRELWRESYRVWFSGKSDPAIALLRFHPFDAEYWDNSGVQGIRHAFAAASAYLRGEKIPVEESPRVHGKLSL